MGWQETPRKKSYECNGELLAQLRKGRGWTQSQLAQESGYSERLISKAEASQPVSAETVADLADALNTPDEPIFPEDLIADPLAMAKAYIAAEYEHPEDVVGCLRHFLADDITVRLTGDPDLFPWVGEHHGIAEMERAYELFYSMIEPPPNHDWRPWYKFVGQGNEVMVWGKNWMGMIGQPLTEPIELVHRFVFQRGMLVLKEVLFDRHHGSKELDKARERHGE
ncbi:MAG: helix-turn-helix domain-containing protein [Planctomycetales bacterium]|nr:helix-turn-helix domain-containing protein [Planctomycetales bacterium]